MSGLNLEWNGIDRKTQALLSDAGISTIGRLVATTAARLNSIPGFGRKRIAEVEEWLATVGLRLISNEQAIAKKKDEAVVSRERARLMADIAELQRALSIVQYPECVSVSAYQEALEIIKGFRL